MPTTDVQFITDGTAAGTPRYVVFDPDPAACGPWIGNLRDILDDHNLDLDTTPIYLLTAERKLVQVHIESTDEDPDWLDWEVTIHEGGFQGGELVERVELDGGDGGWENCKRTIHVNGF